MHDEDDEIARALHRLHAGGWSVGDATCSGPGGIRYVVTGSNGENMIWRDVLRGMAACARPGLGGRYVAGSAMAGAGRGERSEMMETTLPRPRRGARAGGGGGRFASEEGSGRGIVSR